MNKKVLLLGIVLILLLGGGLSYRTLFVKTCGKGMGGNVTFSMATKAGEWKFDPDVLRVNKCDRITINVYNEDPYDHGLAIDVFGVNKRLPPHATTTIEFTATKAGEFVYYCSVPCGDGHLDQKGKIMVLEVAE